MSHTNFQIQLSGNSFLLSHWLSVVAVYLFLNGFLLSLNAKPRIEERTFKTGLKSPENITFFIRWPWDSEQSKSLGSGASQGLFAYCTPRDSEDDLRKQVHDLKKPEEKGYVKSYLDFADRNQLIIMTWTLGHGFWDKGKSADEMREEWAEMYDELFTQISDEWEDGLLKLIREFDLPSENYLITGGSRGAQWAHRLALRKPKYFKAASIHVNSSYDTPTEEGKGVWWFATTGELENGYEAGVRWQYQCQQKGYSIIFRGDPNIGHSTSPETGRLRIAFLEYALKHKDLPAMDKNFVADLVNHAVYPAEQAHRVPKVHRVYLPTEQMARIYGELVKD